MNLLSKYGEPNLGRIVMAIFIFSSVFVGVIWLLIENILK